MFRRKFIQKLTLGGGVLAIAQASDASTSTATYAVKGFTCVTCAVGLETLLRQQKGVIRAEASYPKASVLIEFNPSVVTGDALKGYIAEMGFQAQEKK